jgi:membrane protein required for colicin V production
MELNTMHWLDVVLLVLVGLGAALGFWSGLVTQVARLLSLGVALWATMVLNEPVTRLLHERIAPTTSTSVLHVIGYVVVFLAVYVTLFALSRLVYKLVRAGKLVVLDRLAGAVLGVLKMVLILAPVCALVDFVALPATEEWMSRSALAPVFAKGTRAALDLVPESYKTQAQDSVDQIRENLQRHAADQAVDLLKIEEALKK